MNEEEYQELKKDIQENGLLEPITLYENEILDGRHRARACEELGIEPKYQNYDGENPLNYVVSLNIKRRHLSQTQKTCLSVELLPAFEEEAKKRSLANLTQNTDGAKLHARGRSDEQVAKLVGVSARYISEAKKIQNEAPEKFEEMKLGTKTLQDVKRELFVLEKEKNLDEKSVIQELDGRKPVLYGDNIFFLTTKIQSRQDSYKVIGKEDNFPTLKRRSWFYHKEDMSEFTLREYAQVQDFPDSYKFVGTYEKIKDQIGNAVSPKMAQFIGKKLEGKTVGDLFAGAGGLSCGLELLGKETKWAVERNIAYARTFAFNHPNTRVYTRDIKTLDPKDFENVDIIVGGPPCQGFSLSGLRFKDDPRNELYKEFVRFVEVIKPKEFLMENVPQVLEIKDNIIEDFNNIGYEVSFEVVKGSEIGMRQHRKRVFFYGHTN